MPHEELSSLLRQGDFDALFRRMGWDNPEHRVPVEVDDSVLRPVPVADKRGITAWLVDCPNGLPKRSEQHRVVRRLKRLSRDQLVVFATSNEHLWQWPEQRPSGVGYRLVDHRYPIDAPTDALLQRLSQATFKIEEESQLTSSSVLTQVRRSFNADKVTKSFYREFQKHHKTFAMKVEGIAADTDRRWYASVLLNRLMFIYFIQQKGFLDGDQSYLRSRLEMVREHYGADRFYAFYKQFLLPLFHEGLGSPPDHRNYGDAKVERIIGHVPYVNGGIFELHELEATYDIQIPDGAFQSLFNFFDAWRWHLDERPHVEGNEINPDVLGYIFEQYINFTEAGQKEKGAYYTKPDVTGYMAESSILPAVADRLVSAGLEDPAVLLAGSSDAFIRDSLGHGIDHDVSPPGGGGWPWQRRSGDLAEYVELDLPNEDVALTGERWCDVVHRREHYIGQVKMLSDPKREWSIDDAITENLALPELMRAYMSQLGDADECQRAFEVLRSLTVCDPTVGSGAFLFAAIDVLEPLYSEVLARAKEFEDDGRPVPTFLSEASEHKNPRYWLVKTICLRNLFGVDLMHEAPEIAKLRLFLKLAAQIDRAEDLEPLPDLDFNIKCGNLLVGIADSIDANSRLMNEGQLDIGGEIERIEGLSGSVADAYEEFITEQAADAGTLDHVNAKQKLTAQLEAARNLSDNLLHSLRNETADFSDWRASHQPFHWFVEFPSVWRNGGFDVVIGNPPYIKKSLVTDYTWLGYKTEKCPDLYALCMERATTLVNGRGRFAMIVMHSLCFGRKFRASRSQLSGVLSDIWVSSYWAGRMGLFTGANPRNAIVIGRARAELDDPEASRFMRWSTRCNRWFSESRMTLFDKIDYGLVLPSIDEATVVHQWAFADPTVVVWAHQMVESGVPIEDALVDQSDHFLGYKTTALYQLGVFVDEPPTIDPDTGDPAQTNSARSGWLYFQTEVERDLALVMLAGRWGYLWWLTYSDEFHVTRSTLTAFPGDIEMLAKPAPGDMELATLVDLSRTLREEMPNSLAWMKKAGVLVGRYNMLKLRHLTDKADWLLAKAWGLDEEAFEAAGNLRDRMIFGNKE